MSDALWVVMPVFNEEASVEAVIDEWLPVLRSSGVPFRLLAINDGSKDATLALLRGIARRVPELRVHDHPNRGHGQSCLVGYRLALEAGARWVFQIDSDGQCDPRYFPGVWAARISGEAIFGWRRSRDDGWARLVISRVVSVFSLAATGIWVRDANVPYRLMSTRALAAVVDRVPSDFHLANVLVSVLLESGVGIRWKPIHFRDRVGGTPSVKTFSFVRHGAKLYRQLRAATAPANDRR